MRCGKEAKESASGEVRVAFGLRWSAAAVNVAVQMFLAVKMIPLLVELAWILLDANVRKVDW